MEPRIKYADVAELADALVSGSSEAIHVGSSPVVRTKTKGRPQGLLFALGTSGQFSGKPSNFVLKTVINCFLNARHRPHQKKTQDWIQF